jgi:two-component system, OmpR family, sensor histidine kinase KdpD
MEQAGRADNFLRMIQRSRQGRLKVYLGYAAGVGKTYQMLLEGHRLKAEGIDVVIGFVETHGRADTARLTEGLEMVPRLKHEYHGIVIEEMDTGAVISRKPDVALVDELAHTNVPGTRNHKRYEDVEDILAAGIHVITTVNIQHLESLYNTVERGLGVVVRERLPDNILAKADEIINIDLSEEDLRQRLEDGKVYPEERVRTALSNFFTPSNLEQLREMTLRELASQIDLRRREAASDETPPTPDQVMVCLSSRGPNSEMLLRYGSRLAGRLNRNWYAVYVQTSKEAATVVDAVTQRLISNTLTVAKQLGATVFTYKGEDVADTILRFAKEYRVGLIVVGSPARRSFWRQLVGGKSLVHRLIDKAKDAAVVVVDTASVPAVRWPVEIIGEETPVQVNGREARGIAMNDLVGRSIVFWDDPVPRDEALRALVHMACRQLPGCSEVSALHAIMARESEGSTFLNEGLAIPHARLDGLNEPGAALGVARGGITGEGAGSTRYIVLSLTPGTRPDVQIDILAEISRAFQDRIFLKAMDTALTADDVRDALALWTGARREARSSLS